ncbi:hypothetical protein NEMBOFW57_010759 [Staphylotrichum longicolle]|uniref:Uncharacterized protein n=1 Tax=Staphylotrichum longicolle TaxID=669026 RepID=A0AAD4HV22_9PEZI|nr:hypothetical protein NEMBOFW57_010759 [Staphylotrichum longicolle]
MLWLVGRPGAGKSVLAGHVVEQLDAPHTYCSYFICKHGSAGESTLSDCFRSIAFQMATQDESVGRALLQLARDGLVWDKTDDTSVWRRLFTGCIFKLPSLSRHYWVVDGALSDSDTIEDMRLFVMTRLTELVDRRPPNRERMCAKILSKSTGSFLWARLVLQEFEDAWTEEAMDDILREIPEDLFELYSRMVHFIEADKRKLLLARSILTWIVLACRPLTVDEVRAAVKLDVNQTLQNAAKAIPDLCAQLTFSGSLCVFDYLTMEMRVRQPDVFANCVACSADGRTIITGSNRGVIRIFELRQSHNSTTVSLNTIYQMNDPFRDIISAVAFNVDGMRFVDIRGQQGRVWAPAALVRKSTNELESSIGTSGGDSPGLFIKPFGGMFDTSNNPDITTSLVVSADARFIVAGRANGEVVLFSGIDGVQVGVLYQHARGASILYLEFVESSNTVISADVAGRVLIVDLRCRAAIRGRCAAANGGFPPEWIWDIVDIDPQDLTTVVIAVPAQCAIDGINCGRARGTCSTAFLCAQ